MLKLVESLAVKAERAKRTAIEFTPLRDRETGTYKCAWCEAVVRGKRKGWSSYCATDHKPVQVQIHGDVCSRWECRISLQAKYTKR
jgi:hypothetical protein